MSKEYYRIRNPGVGTMRYKSCSVTGILALNFFFSASCLAQSSLKVNESATRVQLLDESTSVELAVENAGRETLSARVSLDLVNPLGFVQSRADKQVSFPPGRTKVSLSLPPVIAQNERSDRQNLLWYRLRYSIAVAPASGAVGESVHGILSVSEVAPQLFELHVAAPLPVKEGSRTAIRVRAVHPVTLHPVEGVIVQASLDLDKDDGKPLLTPTARTDRQGFATLSLSLPRNLDSEDDNQIDIKVSGKLGNQSAEADGELYLNHFYSILLSTDKPLYQPGQELHMRLVVFDPDHKAFVKQPVNFEIRDPDYTLVFSASPQTSRFGVASAGWQIPGNLRLGEYEIRATIGEGNARYPNAQANVKISRYELPSFSVGVKPDRAYYLPGESAEIEVRADYLFGEPVRRGRVRVAQESERQWNFREQKWDITEASSYEGETDEQGRYVAHVDLSAEHDRLSGDDYERFRDITFAAYYTDGSTGRTEQRRFDIRLTKDPIHVYLIPGNQVQPKGLPMEFYLSTDYADGSPAECEVEILWSTADMKGNSIAPVLQQLVRRVRTNRYGVAKVTALHVPATAVSRDMYLSFRAKDRKGLVGQHSESGWDTNRAGVRIETNKTLYAPGEPIDVELSSGEQNLILVVDVARDDQVLASRLVHMHHGRASFVLGPNEKLQNEVTIAAYTLGSRGDDRYNNIRGSHTVFFPKNHELSIDIHASKPTYRPGEEASATIHVTGPEGDQGESALGLVVVDKAIEERARTDRDFGGTSGFFRFRDKESGYEELNGVRKKDLDKLDLTKPLPDGFEVAVEALLQTSGAGADIFTSERRDEDLHKIFALEIDPVLKPLLDALNLHYQQQAEYPKTEAALRSELVTSGIRLDDLLDPWGTPFRAKFSITNEMDVLELTSAGPDKKFDTEDDFQATEVKWPYFKPYAEAIQTAVKEFHERTGGYVRDLQALKNELARRGIDLGSMRDPWGHEYVYEFGVQQTKFILTVISLGPDRNFDSKWALSDYSFTVGTFGIDYFSDTLAKIDAALNKTFQDTHSFPENTEQLIKSLQNSGIAWGDLKDPWGHPYYATFLQNSVVYADRKTIETYENHMAREAQRREIVPVTRQINYVYIRSAGEDGIEGTPDDFYVASFSRVALEQSSQAQGSVPPPDGTLFSGPNGAISGIVRDPAGGAMFGAKVTATDVFSGHAFTATADDGGNYVLRNLPAGSYRVQFESIGFKASVITDVPVRSSNVTKLDATLEVGETYQTVTVSEVAPLVQTASATLAPIAKGTKSGSLPLQAMTPRLREYFPETLLWQPELVTDSKGHARVKFPLADNITTWKLSAIASTETGEIGTVEKEIRAFQPFFVEHDPPKFLTAGDEIELPIVMRNYLDHNLQMTAELKPEAWFTTLSPASVKAAVPPRDSKSELFKFRATAQIKNGKQRITANGAEVGDAIERTVTVRPNGEEHVDTISEIFGDSAGVEIQIPENTIPGSLEGTLKIYPNLNAHVLESIEGILERPYGCAEQTISSTYPSLLLLQYAKDKHDVSPSIVSRATHYVQLGYGRLLSYQANDGGITYWGRGDSDPALTAYAMKFLSDARGFVNVDDSMAQSELSWLVRHEQDDGRWVAPFWGGQESANRTAVLTAYIAQIIATTPIAASDPAENARLTKAASLAVAKALSYLDKQVGVYDEPYLIASYALTALAVGDKSRVAESLQWLRKLEHREGNFSYWSLETNTPFYGWGLTGRIETTALVLQAFEKASENGTTEDPLVSRGLLFLLRNQDRLGIWFSTQATVNVLETLHSLTARKGPEGMDNSSKANRKASILVDGRQAFTLDLPGPDEFAAPITADISRFVSPGTHHLEISKGVGSARASLQLIRDYYVPWVHSAKDENLNHKDKSSDTLRLRVGYDKQSVKVGEGIRCSVEAERIGFHGYGMLLAEIGLPPGAEVDRSSMETAMKESGWDINQYEVLPDRLVVYLWPHAGGTKFSFTFKPRFGLKALTASSTLYDYYNPEAQTVVEPTQFSVD
jgi:hypothetical protein